MVSQTVRAAVVAVGILAAVAVAKPPADARPPDPGGAGPDRPAGLDGVWAPLSSRRLGKDLPTGTTNGMRFSFAGHRVRFQAAGEDVAGTFRADAAGAPGHIDLALGGRTIAGLYRLDGDTLRLSYYRPEDPRPVDLDGDGVHFVYALKRAAAGPGEAAAGWPEPAGGAAAPHAPSPYPTDPGCQWLVHPDDARTALWGQDGVNAVLDRDRDGALLVTLAAPAGQHMRVGFRPVAFDAGRRRHVPDQVIAKTTGDGVDAVRLARYRLDPKAVPGDKVAAFGVELVTPRSFRLAREGAAARARARGVDVLAFPEVGRPFGFAVTALDGKRLTAEGLRGKVVLVNCWATWCRPCMAKMPRVKRLYEKWHGSGLEVVGVSLDEDPDAVRKACQERGLDWPQAVVPAGEGARALWEEASGITAIPRLLLVDRDGVLRADNPEDLEAAVEKVIAARPAGSRK